MPAGRGAWDAEAERLHGAVAAQPGEQLLHLFRYARGSAGGSRQRGERPSNERCSVSMRPGPRNTLILSGPPGEADRPRVVSWFVLLDPRRGQTGLFFQLN